MSADGETGVRTAVTFKCGGELFAFTADCLTEINNRSDFTPIPALPDYISGVINIMGDVIPVIDLRRRLGFPDCEYTRRSCLMVIRSGENRAAVRVDEAVTALEYGVGDFMELPEKGGFIAGYITSGGGRIQVINEERIFEYR